MDIAIMMNNFLHDFAVALLFASLVVLASVYRVCRQDPSGEKMDFGRIIFRHMNRVIVLSWVVIIVGGIIRTITYEEFEWAAAAGRGQVTALVVKHVLLVLFVVGGTSIQIRLRKHLRSTR